MIFGGTGEQEIVGVLAREREMPSPTTSAVGGASPVPAEARR